MNEETQKTIKSRKRWILILCILLPLIAVFKFTTVSFAEAVPHINDEQLLYQASGYTEEPSSTENISPSGIPNDPGRVEDIVDKPVSITGEFAKGINSMWSAVGQTVQNFASDGTMFIGFNTTEMETFAEGLAFIFKTLGYAIIVMIFGLNTIELNMKFEYYDKRQYFKTFFQIILGKFWVDLSIRIVLLIFRTLNTIAYTIADPSTMELLPEYTVETSWYSNIPIIGALIDLIMAIFELLPFLLTLLVMAIVIFAIFIKLTIRCFEMTCLVTVAPPFMACFAGDVTKKYGQRYVETVVSISLELVFIAIVYTIGLQWLNKLAAESPNGIVDFGSYASRLILIVAMGVVICKPPKVLTGLVG